jgi:hypothetical protein
MTQLARAARTLTQLTAAGANLADAAFKMGESAVAAGAVIGHRVALGAQAMHDPANVDPGEFTRMSTEKLTAFTASSQAVLGEWQSMQHEMMKFAIGQAAGCMRAVWDVASAFSPDQALAAQRRWAVESLARANSHTMKLAALSAGISGLALAPVHETVTDNARRLSRPK